MTSPDLTAIIKSLFSVMQGSSERILLRLLMGKKMTHLTEFALLLKAHEYFRDLADTGHSSFREVMALKLMSVRFFHLLKKI